MDPNIKTLLTLQEYDIELRGAQDQLSLIPAEIKVLEAKVAQVKAKDQAARDELKNLEVQRSTADTNLKEAEAKIIKLKTQQMEVKKNEEYQALTKEIEAATQAVSDSEDKELEIMEQIESKQAALKDQEAESADRISDLDGQISQVRKQESALQERVNSLSETVENAKKDCDCVYLSKYEQVARQVPKGPYVVPLHAAKCDGCHLKVSNDVISAAKQADHPEQCDSCARIVYWPKL